MSRRPLLFLSVALVLAAASLSYACGDDNTETPGPKPPGDDSGTPPPPSPTDGGDAGNCPTSQFTWATSGGGAGQNDDVTGVAVDKDGNTWVTGTFIGDATWGSVALSSPDKVHASAFFAKLDPTGKVLLARAIVPSTGDDTFGSVGARIRVDAAGKAYVAGTFQKQVDLDGVHLVNHNAGSEAAFLIGLDATGKALWGTTTKNDGGSREEGFDLAVDAAGDVYLAGSYNGRIMVDALEAPAAATTSDQAIFVAKYSPSMAKWLWVDGWSGQTANSGGEAHAIALGSDGSVYLGGTIENDVDFRNGQYFTDATGSFVAKVKQSDGTLLWSTDLAPPSDQAKVLVNAMTADASGNVFVTGSFTANVVFAAAADVASFDGGAVDAGAHELSLGVTGGEDMFVVKYDASGKPAWAKHAGGGTGVTRGDDIAFDGASGLYIGGFHQGTITFDAQTLSHTGNLFVARYDTSGAIQWVQGNDNASHAGGEALGIAVPSATSGVYIGGSYDTDTTLGSFMLTSAGMDDGLVAHTCN